MAQKTPASNGPVSWERITTDVIDSQGLKAMECLQMLSQYHLYRNAEGKAWLEKFTKRFGKPPTSLHAASYSSVRTYLKAIQETGTDDADVVLDWMRKQTVNDAFADNGKIRPDGMMSHDMYLVRIKGPGETKGPGDYFNLVTTLPADQANQPLAESACPLLKN